MADIQNLFEELKTTGDHTDLLNPCQNTLDAFSRIIGQSIYVVDYEKKKFVYVSSNPLFLCGFTPEKALEMGFSFYNKVVNEEDMVLIEEVDKRWFDLFCRLPVEVRLNSTLSFNYRIKTSDNQMLMVCQQNTPICLNEHGRVRYALCLVSLSTHRESGKLMIKVDTILHSYAYSFESKKWKKVRRVDISKREKEILRLAAQGSSNKEIANTLFINISTVKFHKTNIYSKLDVKNITEAVMFAYHHKLL